MDMIEIDGAAGGGQLLRTALSLALCTGTGFTMRNIRASRSRPGLLRQHLTAVQAAAAVGQAQVHGAELGSTAIRFEPGAPRAGDYTFALGTAGSTMLVLQTLLPALWRAEAPSRVRLEGGTHNPMAPSCDFIAHTFLPVLARMGVQATLTLERHGFYPAGGGAVDVVVEPCMQMSQVVLDARGALQAIEATALLSALEAGIGRRELAVLAARFDLPEEHQHFRSVRPAIGPGNALTVRVQHTDHVETFTNYGERGVTAERVADRLATQVQAYLDAPAACVSEH
ncbi:MAG: RNA 3'-terminal phosphate cyclase, partial [Lysobacter sp.]|nr:RNA 3'-terminal phosphate cyclase [Lysobacter sp.]